MDKYTLLIILNLPFILFGVVRAAEMHHKKLISKVGLINRLVFWTLILAGLVLFEQIYEYLIMENLTDSAPLSIMEVMLVTAVIFLFSISLRLYSKTDELEKQLTDLHEKLSIMNSEKTNGRK
jgi:hypothetical protein